MGDFLGRRREGGIDRPDLGRVDGELAGEPFRCRGASLGDQSGLVAEVGEHAIDRLNLGRGRAGQA